MHDMWVQETMKDEPNLDVKFQYALTLIKTRSHDKNRQGMSLLEGGLMRTARQMRAAMGARYVIGMLGSVPMLVTGLARCP